MDRWKMAWEIYGALKLAGAEIGDASVPIIGEVLGEYITDDPPRRGTMKLLKIQSKNSATLDAILMIVPDDYSEDEALEAAIDVDNPVIAEEINIGDLGDFDLYHPFLG